METVIFEIIFVVGVVLWLDCERERDCHTVAFGERLAATLSYIKDQVFSITSQVKIETVLMPNRPNKVMALLVNSIGTTIAATFSKSKMKSPIFRHSLSS